MVVRTLLRGAAAALAFLCLSAALASARPLPRLAASPAARSTAALARSLQHYLRAAGGHSSALVVDTTTHQTLYAASPNTPRLPASVEKLFTTSAALFDLGTDFSLQTGVYGVGSVSGTTFSGRLFLKGGGDPTFGAASFDAHFYGTGATVQQLLRALRHAGITRIRGQIIGDASIFDNLGGGPDSGYRPATETEGELSGLAYDAGWTSRAEVALQSHPALWAARALASVAPTQGITIAPGTRVSTGITPAGARLLAAVRSPNLATLLKLTNAPSDNFFAEMIEKDLGAHIAHAGTTAAGAAVVRRAVATDLGLQERTDDGSGLSRHDRTTATTVVRLLEEMQPSQAFYDSLAVAGISGTMVDEMLHTPAANNCRGKTGTLSDVANLVGYCVAANGDHLVFAFLENGVSDSVYGHSTEDLMGEALADYAGSGQGTPAPELPQPDAGAGVPTHAGSTTSVPAAPTTTTSSTTTTPLLSSPGGGVGF